MNNIDWCYEILGIKPGASPEKVKQAYRDLAMVWHPDRFPADNPRLKEKAQEELKKINAAYEVLKSHLVGSSANTKSSGSADAKSDRTSSQNSYPPKSEDARTYYEQGIDKAKKGKYQEAKEDFDREILINPNFAEAYKYRGIAYSKLGDKQRAFYDFKHATNLYLRQGNIDDYYSVIELIKKLQTFNSVTTVGINSQNFLLTWLVTAISLIVTANLVPGFVVTSFGAALLAAVVIGLVNAIVKPILVLLTLPLTIITLGLFLFVVNAITIWLAGVLTPGFTVTGLLPALLGSIVLTLVASGINFLVDRIV